MRAKAFREDREIGPAARLAARALLAAVLVGLLFLSAASCGKHDSPTNGGTPPSVVIHSPDEGDSLSGIGFTVSGIVSDEDGIEAIRLRAGDSTFATGAASPFSFHFPALLFDAGTLEIVVEAEDVDGAKGSASALVKIRERTLRSIGSPSDTEREPCWSPDGARIAFSSEGSGGNRDIYTVSAEGGAATQVVDSPNNDVQPDWSPLGDRIAFASNRTVTWAIWTALADGGDEIQVTPTGSNERGPVWSPSGARLAYHSDRDGNWNIYSVPVASGAASGSETAYTTAATAESSATWRSDGDALALVSNQLGGSDVWTIEPPDPILGSVQGANDGFFRELDPDFPAKGSVLLFSDNRNGNYDIWALDLVSGRKRVLAAHLMTDREPAWSPRGDRIAFASNRGGTWDIWILE